MSTYLESRLWPEGPKCPVCGLGERITARAGGFYRCNQCKEDFTVRTALTLSAAHVFDFPQENGPVLKGDFVETIVAQGDADGSMFGVVGIRPCRDGEWDIGEHEGCGKDTERAVRRYA